MANISQDQIESIESELSPIENDVFQRLYDRYPDLERETLHVVVTDDMWRDIHQHYLDHDLQPDFSKLKGMVHVVKIITCLLYTSDAADE